MVPGIFRPQNLVLRTSLFPLRICLSPLDQDCSLVVAVGLTGHVTPTGSLAMLEKNCVTTVLNLLYYHIWSDLGAILLLYKF